MRFHGSLLLIAKKESLGMVWIAIYFFPYPTEADDTGTISNWHPPIDGLKRFGI